MQDFEKLGVFYLGRLYDLDEKKAAEDLLLYDSKDLVTHAVCVGMTGSGKTGLCIGLLEEAALDGIPALVIDPKGDLPNLLLTFPELRPEDFRPWINEEEAGRKGLSPDDFAKQQAETWTKGLAGWGEDADRIRRLKESADFAIYTPGSTAGLPVSILKSFAAPGAEVRGDPEALRDRINTTVTSLLGLLGVEADPIKSREHILLSTMFNLAWSAGRGLDLATLIQQIQSPPFAKVGVLDLEPFYPSKDRFELAMLVNNLLAAPTFQTWMDGEALDIGRMLHTAEGKPRVSIFSIAHLSDPERMFFVSLLLNEVLGWMRAQPGTGSLRAIVYMDEIFGFFPPVANPPSKTPLLTLLKQARAFGVGIVLATQNPVDLDYKGLANAGTWFIGRLQTERDKERLLEGLEGVAAGSQTAFDRGEMGEILAGLGNRVFLMYNVHEDAPVVFSTRWAMSYLAGPLTRSQIKTLMDPRRPAEIPQAGGGVAPTGVAGQAVPAAAVPAAAAFAPPQAAAQAAATVTLQEGFVAAPPPLPAELVERFIPRRGAAQPGSALVYLPGVYAAGRVAFVDTETGTSEVTRARRLGVPLEGTAAVNWDEASAVDLATEDLEDQPETQAAFGSLPPAMTKLTAYREWERDFAAWAFRTQTLELLRSPGFGAVSKPSETEGEFRARLQLLAREQRDKQAEALRTKYAAKLASLEERARKAEYAVEREAEQAKARKMQTAISFGATILGAFTGRKRLSTGTLGRATTAMRDVGRSMDEAGDTKRAEDNLAAIKQKHADLEAEFQSELDSLEAQFDPMSEVFEKVLVRPRKSDIAVEFLALTWIPHWRRDDGTVETAWQ